MKTERGILSENQKKFFSQMQNQGFNVLIIRNIDEFKKEIQKILKK
jgi:uncharacterized protein (UPF0335 family)